MVTDLARPQIAHLKNRIGAKIAQSVNIVGYRRQGKSSVLGYIKDRPETFFPAAQQPLIVFLDLQAGRFHSPEGVTEGIRRACMDADPCGIAEHLGEEFWTREENTYLFAMEDGLEELRHRG